MLLWTQGYGGPRLFPIDQLEHDVVVLVEGELDALACISHGIPAITATTGALTWPDHLSVPFKEKDVVILPDADPAGRKGAQKRAQSLRKAGAQVRVVSWPEKQPEGWDATDELHGRGVDSLRALIDTASFPNDETADGAQDKKRESQAVALVQLASQSTELFHDETDTPYACLWIGDHRQIWCLDSPRFRRWLARRLFEEEGKVPSGEALSTAMNRWRVKQSSTESVIRFTCALPGTRDAFYYDLTDPAWCAIRVTHAGWQIVDKPPILFKRFSHQSGPSRAYFWRGDSARLRLYLRARRGRPIDAIGMVCGRLFARIPTSCADPARAPGLREIFARSDA